MNYAASTASASILNDKRAQAHQNAKNLRVFGHFLTFFPDRVAGRVRLPAPTRRGDTESRYSSLARLCIRAADLLDEHERDVFNFSITVFLLSSRVTFHTWKMLLDEGVSQQFFIFEDGVMTINTGLLGWLEDEEDVDCEWLVNSSVAMSDGVRGNTQAVVLKAIIEGAGTYDEIASATGLDRMRVRKNVYRMRYKPEPPIRRDESGRLVPTDITTTRQEGNIKRAVARISQSRLKHSSIFAVNEHYKSQGFEIRRLPDGDIVALDHDTGEIHPGQADERAWIPMAKSILAGKIIPVMKRLDGKINRVRIVPTNWQRLFPWSPNICSKDSAIVGLMSLVGLQS